VRLCGEEAKGMCNHVEIQLQGKKIHIDKNKREGFIKDPTFSSRPEGEEKVLYDALDYTKKIDVIHSIFDEDGKRTYQLEGTRPVSLVDASHDLQIEKGDKNCSLYGYNFLQGIADMLEDKEIADKVYMLAEQIDAGNEKEKGEAEKALAVIFREDLKRYLSCYYEADGQRKGFEEVKLFHLLQRWDLGSATANLETLRQIGYLS
jgi:hypothetical protein